jgi:hypothetical protein
MFQWRYAIAMMKEAVSTAETSVNFYQTTPHNMPEGTWCHEKKTLTGSQEMLYCNEVLIIRAFVNINI